ncbi:hypothetical protein LINPERHAP1_LOCUS4608 [Linum perenne]
MVVSLVYHVGEFVVNSNTLVYEEGELVIIEEVDPVMITLFDLRHGISITSSVSGEFRLYFKLKLQNGTIEYRVLNDEKSVRDLLIEYKDTNVYDIFIDAKSWVEDGVGINNEEWLEEDSEDNDFEVGSWIKEEDMEELEEIRQKVQEAKSHLKEGIPITANDVEDVIKGFEGDEFSSDESGFYVTIDEDDEVADHGVRIPNPLPKYSPRTEIPYFCHGLRFTDIIECSGAKSIITHKTLASYTEEYALLRIYAVEMLRSNLGSSTTVMVDRDNPTSEPLFQRMYVCFDALKKGFLA